MQVSVAMHTVNYVITLIIIYLSHSCTFPGCRSVLVMDGNMKNRRDTCSAKDAGFIQFAGLSGSIKTGCTATPAFKSRYCSEHMNQACTLLHSEEADEDLGPTLRSRHPKISEKELVAEKILAKKTTKMQTYYQVQWRI